MKLPVVGPAYQDSATDVNNQRCVNMFVATSGPEGRGEIVLVPTAGMDLIEDFGGGNPIRCLTAVGDYLYIVAGNSVIQAEINPITRVATYSTIGTMITESGSVYAAVNPTQIMWVDGSADGWIYTIGTGVFEKINDVDADFPGGVQCLFLDGYFIVNQPDSGKFFVSALNDGRSWDPLDVATAENSTDNLIGMGASKGDLWLFGEKSVEIWYNAANPTGSPFSARDGLAIQTGCGAASSIVAIDDLLIWLDNRGYIVQSAISPFVRSNNSGYDLQIISTEALTAAIKGYALTTDAVAFGYNDRGHLMYQITFPTAQKTWVYDYTSKMWHERSYYSQYADREEEHLAQYGTVYKSITIAGGHRGGKIYAMDPEVYTDDGEIIRRIRVTSPQNIETWLFAIDQLELRMESGTAPQSGTYTDPQITMRYSIDGGHTWSYHLSRSIGAAGQYAKMISWNRLGIGREWMFEFTVSAPIKFKIIDAHVRISKEEL